jgi:nicotinic acid mononucleotide adenylyltransferase
MFLRELFEAPKTAVFAFGRMNPPTIGHAKLADVVKSQQGDPFLFLSQTQKPKTDPLPFPEKMYFASKSFPGVEIGDPKVKTIIQAMQNLEAKGYTDIVYVAGSDRVDSFTKLLNDYNGKDYKFNSIKIVSAGERDPDAEGAEGMSASKMRAAAQEGDYNSFKKGVASPMFALSMYDQVRKGMGIATV